MSVQNPEVANEMAEAFRAEQVGELEDAAELQQTRADLESTHVPDGGTETELATVSAGSDTDIDSADTDEQQGFAMTVDRRAGTTHLDIAYVDDDGDDCEERMAFGKPSSRSSIQLMQPLEEAEEDEVPLSQFSDYVWPTIASWCCAESAPDVEVSPQDADFWADSQGLGDNIDVLRKLAFGGDPNAL